MCLSYTKFGHLSPDFNILTNTVWTLTIICQQTSYSQSVCQKMLNDNGTNLRPHAMMRVIVMIKVVSSFVTFYTVVLLTRFIAQKITIMGHTHTMVLGVRKINGAIEIREVCEECLSTFLS